MLDAGPGVRMELLAWGNTLMEPHLFRIAPSAGSGESYAHEGEEFLYILRGALEISLADGERHRSAGRRQLLFRKQQRASLEKSGQEGSAGVCGSIRRRHFDERTART